MTTTKDKRKKEFKLEDGYCSNCLAVPIELNYHYVLKDDCKCNCHQRNMKTKDWEKEAQKWLDELSIIEIEMVNSIVYWKLKQQKQELKDRIKKMKKSNANTTIANPTFPNADRDYYNAYNQAIDDILKLL